MKLEVIYKFIYVFAVIFLIRGTILYYMTAPMFKRCLNKLEVIDSQLVEEVEPALEECHNKLEQLFERNK